MKKALFIFGTRPEAIKLASLIAELKKDKKNWRVIIAISGQHREMLDQVLDFFQIKAEYDLNLMKPGQSLSDLTAANLRSLEKIIKKLRPDLIIVQGDTTTALSGALAGYYQKIPVAHIEAGLRTNDKFSPWPEEINRRLISQLADYHFAPTTRAAANLRNEGYKNSIYMVGNTVIDALKLGLKIIKKNKTDLAGDFKNIDLSKKIILVTGHRRESFGAPLKNICVALRDIAKLFPKIEIIYPVHLNPIVQTAVYKNLRAIKNIHLLKPLDYPHLIWLMKKSYLVITDSGGLQEEAPFLGKPVLVTRVKTERPEGIKAGAVILVGSDRQKIVKAAGRLLSNKAVYAKMGKTRHLYGNGTSSRKIAKILRNIK